MILGLRAAFRAFVCARDRAVRNARDFATLNRHAAELNAEAADTLAAQTVPDCNADRL
jgi:hypothetical protein